MEVAFLLAAGIRTLLSVNANALAGGWDGIGDDWRQVLAIVAYGYDSRPLSAPRGWSLRELRIGPRLCRLHYGAGYGKAGGL